MRLSPLDIKKQEFNRGFRGFEEEEVIAYLQTLADQWDDLLDDNRKLESKVSELENKLEHYQRVEDALQEALNTAKSTSKTKLANAEQEASLIRREAQASAEGIIHDARAKNDELHSANAVLEQRQREILAKLKAFLSSEIELLSNFSSANPVPDIPAQPEPIRHDAAAANGQADSGRLPIRNVEVDVDNYGDEIGAETVDWNEEQVTNQQPEFGTSYDQDESSENSVFDNPSYPEAEDLDEAGSPADAADASDDSSEQTFGNDRPPRKDNVSPADMDKIRQILDKLD